MENALTNINGLAGSKDSTMDFKGQTSGMRPKICKPLQGSILLQACYHSYRLQSFTMHFTVDPSPGQASIPTCEFTKAKKLLSILLLKTKLCSRL